jgi:glycerol-3-phosphate acyltransferase PlsY
MNYILSILIGYLFGCFQTSYIMGKFFMKKDIREHGTSNAGASNATIVFGWKFGVITALVDIGKTIAAVIITGLLFNDDIILKYLAGTFCIIGHIFPFYLGFKGGKGFASYMGLILAFDWKLGLIMMGLSLLITVITNYIAISTLFTTVSYPLYTIYKGHHVSIIFMLFLLFLIITYKHKPNIVKIRDGNEKGLREVIKKKKR